MYLLLFVSSSALAEARQISDYEWTGVERVVAIGDIHGDYANYIAVLEAAGLVDRKGKWSGGETHLVQVGDIPDRGPDTQEIIKHIRKLAKQAKRKGGRVHSLIGQVCTGIPTARNQDNLPGFHARQKIDQRLTLVSVGSRVKPRLLQHTTRFRVQHRQVDAPTTG